MTKKATASASDTPAAARLLALLLLGDDTEAGHALAVACKAGVQPNCFAGKTARAVFDRAMGGCVGGALRESFYAEGVPLEGILAAAQTEEYVYRVAETPGRWARAVCDEARNRRCAELGRHLAESPGDLESYAGELQQILDTRSGGDGDVFGPKECSALWRAELERVEHERVAGTLLSTGYPDLDALCGPLSPGEVTIVAARTSVGKSKFAQNVLHNNACAGKLGHCYSMEQSKEQVCGRLWSIDTCMPVPESVAAAVGAAYEYPVHICDTARLSAAAIAARVKHSVPRPRLVVVDYLGLMEHPVRGDSTEAWGIGESTKQLRASARSLRFHNMLLCQINRAGAEGVPQLHHLRGSGDVEQDADRILLLSPGRDHGELWVEVAKNRVTGRCGKVKLRSVGGSCRLEAA